MRTYQLEQLSNSVLLRELHSLVVQGRKITAAILAHISEVDERRLYAPAGYSSMHAYCVGELRFSENAAFRRIRAARAARRFPELFGALASGSIHLTAILLLAPHLTEGNLAELLAAATRLRKPELERYLAERFGEGNPPAVRVTRLLPYQEFAPAPEFAPTRERLPAAELLPASQLAPAPVHVQELQSNGSGEPIQTVGGSVRAGSSELAPHTRLELKLAPEFQQKLSYARALLSHSIPSGDIAKILDRALDALIERAEKRKFGAAVKRNARTAKPRDASAKRDRRATKPHTRESRSRAPSRYIPVPVRRAVWVRDGGRCTFVGENGHRCGARQFIEFDHVEPVARGGRATESGVRLRCRTHNQLEAERVFGTAFMAAKRSAARETAYSHEADVLAALRQLGYRAGEARRAAAHAITDPRATLEESVRIGLQYLAPARAPTRARP